MRRFIPLALLSLFALFFIGCPFGVTHYREPDGSLVYVGNFSNEGDLALVNARVDATAYDAAGNVTATASNSLCEILPGKGILPFEVTFPPGTGDPARVEFKVVGTPTAEPYLATGLQARVVSETLTVFGSSTWVTGEVTNTSANHYYRGYICASWTDPSGNVIRTTYGSTSAIDMPPGKTLPFALSVDLPPDPQLRVNFYLDAGVFPPDWPVHPVVTLPRSAYKNTFPQGPDQPLFFFGMGEIHNTTSKPVSAPRISANYRDASGDLLQAGRALAFCGGGDILPPGAFTFGGYMTAGETGEPEIEIEAYDANGIEAYRLTATGVKVRSANLSGSMTGTIKNTSGKTLLYAQVCGGAYSEDGSVIGANGKVLTLPAGGLAPGASLNFSLDLPLVLGEPSKGKAFVTGQTEPHP